MITYQKCTEVSKDAIFQAFQIGFSDYMIRLEMSEDFFLQRFFGPEGNRFEYSVIALDEGKPVGVNLGGIKLFEGVKTLRCGALCIHPDYRGMGISHQLFDLHKEIAVQNDCKQMFLEVIVGNDRAINFYKKKGYEKVYDLVYYSHNSPHEIQGTLPDGYRIEAMSLDALETLRCLAPDVHINWQNDFDYIRQTSDQMHYGILKGEQLSGGLSIHPRGKVSFLWVQPELRHQGLGRALVQHAIAQLNIQKLALSFPNNANLLGFVKHLNFTKDAISQFEMYQTL